VVLGANEQEVSHSLSYLKDLEAQRLCERDTLLNHDLITVEETSSICSLEEKIDLEALNLICSEIAEDLGDGGCDPLCLQTPISQYKKKKYKSRKKI
jgi:hypothetical protein